MRRSLLVGAVVLMACGVLASLGSGARVDAARWLPKEIAGIESAAHAINERGVVAGESENVASTWSGGRLRSLGALGGAEPMSVAYGVGDGGHVVGAAWRDWDSDSRAFVWTGGKMRDLGTLGGAAARAYAVNGRGWIVGWSQTRQGSERSQAFVWATGVMRPLETPEGRNSEAVAINSAGVIVGNTGVGQTPWARQRAVVWRNGRRQDLPTLGGKESGASDINDHGQIAGWAEARDGKRHAVLWVNGRARDLGTRLSPSALNDRGQIVGSCAQQACVWEAGRIIGLGTAGYNSAYATDINDRGDVVGNSVDDCGGGCRPMTVAIEWLLKRGA